MKPYTTADLVGKGSRQGLRRSNSTKALRRKLGEAPRPSRELLSALRVDTLRDQFGGDYRDQLYKGIEGYKPNIRDRLARAREGEYNDPQKLNALRATLAQMKARRLGFDVTAATGRATFDPKTGTWVTKKSARNWF